MRLWLSPALNHFKALSATASTRRCADLQRAGTVLRRRFGAGMPLAHVEQALRRGDHLRHPWCGGRADLGFVEAQFVPAAAAA